MRDKIAGNQRELEEMKESWQKRLEEAKCEWEKKAKEEREQDEKLEKNPYLSNINEDTQLSGIIHHLIATGKTIVGAKGSDEVTEHTAEKFFRLQMKGLSIQKEHAIIRNTGKKVSIMPITNAKVSFTYCNPSQLILVF